MPNCGLSFYVDEDTYFNEEFVTKGFYKNAFSTLRGAYLHLTIKCMRQREIYAEILQKISKCNTDEERFELQKELKKQEDIIDVYENYDIILVDKQQMLEDKLSWRKGILKKFAERTGTEDWRKEYFEEHNEGPYGFSRYLVRKYSKNEEPERKKLFDIF